MAGAAGACTEKGEERAEPRFSGYGPPARGLGEGWEAGRAGP